MRTIRLNDGTEVPKLAAEIVFRRVARMFFSYPEAFEYIYQGVRNGNKDLERKFDIEGMAAFPQRSMMVNPQLVRGMEELEREGIIHSYRKISEDDYISGRQPEHDYYSFFIDYEFARMIKNCFRVDFGGRIKQLIIVPPSADENFKDLTQKKLVSPMGLRVLKDGEMANISSVERCRSLIADLFEKYPKAMLDLCTRIKNIGDDDIIMPFLKYPHLPAPNDAKLADYYSLEMEGVIMDFRLNVIPEPDIKEEVNLDIYVPPFSQARPKDTIIGNEEDRKTHDFYLYEVDLFFARVVRNCVELIKEDDAVTYKIHGAFKSPYSAERAEDESYQYSR